MNGKRKLKSKKKIKNFFKIYIIFILIFVSVMTIAKYTKNINKSHDIAVAKPIAELDINTDFTIHPTEEIQIPFTVRNYNDTNINETLLRYTISITKTETYNFTYKLYKVENGVKTEIDSNTYYNYLSATEQKTYDYILYIKWDESSVPIESLSASNFFEINIDLKQSLYEE